MTSKNGLFLCGSDFNYKSLVRYMEVTDIYYLHQSYELDYSINDGGATGLLHCEGVINLKVWSYVSMYLISMRSKFVWQGLHVVCTGGGYQGISYSEDKLLTGYRVAHRLSKGSLSS